MLGLYSYSADRISGMRRSLSIVLVTALAIGCGSSREAGTKPVSSEELRRHESGFNPSDYNPPAGAVLESDGANRETTVELSTRDSSPGVPELLQGYRVQIFSATNIDEASRKKEEAEGLFPEEWFYLVYDPPTYKIRGGNFLTRFEADRFSRLLAEKGLRDSWIVPDRVYKSPPPRPARPTDQPEE
jgi:hypothetical protein